MQVELKYGRGSRLVSIPEGAEVAVLRPAPVPPLPDFEAALADALHEAGGIFNRPAPRSVAVCAPDSTRPFPSARALAVALKKIFSVWPALAVGSVTVIVGGGLHPPAKEKELAGILPPGFTGVQVIGHDAEASRMTDLGRTRRGTPVRVNTELAAAEFKVALGQVDPHQFVGFTGGAKAAAVGCAAAEMIESNHALMFKPGAEVGRLTGNPVREDLDEAGRIIGLDLAVNAVLGADHRPVAVFSGEPEDALRRAAKVCSDVYGIGIEEKFDAALISCGGHPKDGNLYQAQKGLNLASMAVKEGGLIAMLAECGEGVGDERYLEYVSRFATAREALEEFQRGPFRMGWHKSYLFGRTLTRYDVVVESVLDEPLLRRCHLPAGPVEGALSEFVRRFPGGKPRIAVVPNANTTYFYPATAAGK